MTFNDVAERVYCRNYYTCTLSDKIDDLYSRRFYDLCNLGFIRIPTVFTTVEKYLYMFKHDF